MENNILVNIKAWITAALAELNELDADTLPELPHITLPLDLDIRLSAGDIKCLEPFVTFEGADNA